jgi:hypothetical protein
MLLHRVVDAPDESRDAEDPLKIDPHDLERRGVASVILGELERELRDEGRLARVARPEQRNVRLTFQSERDLIRERVHPYDLRGVVQGTVPDERVDGHGDNVPGHRYNYVPAFRYRSYT